MQPHPTITTPATPAAPLDDAPHDGAETVVLGMVAITFVAGFLEVVQHRRGSDAWPVPLIVYVTLLPILAFILIAARVAGEGPGLWYIAAVSLPLPLIVMGRLRSKDPAG